MLIPLPLHHFRDPILDLVASVNGNSPEVLVLDTGVFQIGHFGSSDFPKGVQTEDYPELSIGQYGVCDNYQQVLEKCPELRLDKDRKFIVTVTKIEKATQPSDGGWRWHKWGEYIGTQEPQCEYIFDEPDIEEVFCYHIYEIL